MKSRLFKIFAAVLVIVGLASAAHAQGSFFTSLSGTVVDSSGGVIPGADVKVKNNGTGAEFKLVADESGYFKAPLVPPGTYTGWVSVAGKGIGNRKLAVSLEVYNVTLADDYACEVGLNNYGSIGRKGSEQRLRYYQMARRHRVRSPISRLTPRRATCAWRRSSTN